MSYEDSNEERFDDVDAAPVNEEPRRGKRAEAEDEDYVKVKKVKVVVAPYARRVPRRVWVLLAASALALAVSATLHITVTVPANPAAVPATLLDALYWVLQIVYTAGPVLAAAAWIAHVQSKENLARVNAAARRRASGN